MPIGGVLESSFGARLTSTFACLLITASSLLSSFCTTTNSLLFCQLLFGIGMGIGYVPPMVNGYKHLPHRKGLVSGVIVGGFGAGSFIFNFIVTGIINPKDRDTADDGYYDDSDIYDMVPTMYRVLAICFLVLGLGGAYLQKEPSKPAAETASLLTNAAALPAKVEEVEVDAKDVVLEGKTAREMFADPLSWMLMLSLFSTAVGGM